MKKTVLAFSLLSLALAADAKPKLLEHIPLQWRATSDLRLDAVQVSAAPVYVAPFTDVRGNKQAIGENREDDPPKPVTTTDDVGDFVGKHVRELFNDAGMTTVDSGGQVIVKGEVTKFFVREEATYKSSVEIHLTVVDPQGKTLWNGTASGDATRFGRSYKAENYYEVLSDAVVNTVSSILQSSAIQKALSGSTALPVAAPAVPAASAADANGPRALQ